MSNSAMDVHIAAMSEPSIQVQRDYPHTLVNSQWVKWAAERIAELEAELSALREITRELADDVTAYVDADRPEELRRCYPHIMAKFDRDIKRAEALLAGGAVDPRRQIDYGPAEHILRRSYEQDE